MLTSARVESYLCHTTAAIACRLERNWGQPRLLLRYNLVLQVFGARMKTNGLAPKVVVGAAIRKLAHLIYCAVKPGNRLMQISLR